MLELVRRKQTNSNAYWHYGSEYILCIPVPCWCPLPPPVTWRRVHSRCWCGSWCLSHPHRWPWSAMAQHRDSCWVSYYKKKGEGRGEQNIYGVFFLFFLCFCTQKYLSAVCLFFIFPSIPAHYIIVNLPKVQTTTRSQSRANTASLQWSSAFLLDGTGEGYVEKKRWRGNRWQHGEGIEGRSWGDFERRRRRDDLKQQKKWEGRERENGAS